MNELEIILNKVYSDIITRKKGRLDIIKSVLDTLYLEENYDIQLPETPNEDVKSTLKHSLYFSKEYGIFFTGFNTNTERFNNILSSIEILDNASTKNTSLEDYENTVKRYPNDYSRVLNYIARKVVFDIIIKYPEVTIKNENGFTHKIHNLFVKQKMNLNGCAARDFRLCRNKFTLDEANVNYIHSHVSTSNFTRTGVVLWAQPCLGTGPIRQSMQGIYKIYDDTTPEELYSKYLLYFSDINNYVKVESLSGVPYIKMETIYNKYINTPLICYTNKFSKAFITIDKLFSSRILGSIWESGDAQTSYLKSFVKEFIKYFIENTTLKYAYIDGLVRPSYSFIDFVKLITNSFYTFYNIKALNTTSEFLNKNAMIKYSILHKAFIENNILKIYNTNIIGGESNTSKMRFNGNPTDIMFKGEVQKLIIKDTSTSEEEDTIKHFISPVIANFIYTTLLKLNFKKDEINPRTIYI